MEKYFTGLNYSLANEDNSVERQFVLNSHRALAVCGSGTRALSLLHDKLKDITIIDISQAQLDYARFKFELIKVMSYEDYLVFMGIEEADLLQRIELFKKYFHSEWVRHYYQQIPKEVIAKGIVYAGKWESFLIYLGKIITFLSGYENYLQDFESKDHAQKYWPEKRLSFLVNILAHPKILNRFLYKGQMIDLKEHHLGTFLLNSFKDSFIDKDPKTSFFLQILFLGKVSFPQAYPLEFQRPIFENIKSYSGKISFVCTDLISAIEDNDFDFASVSNVATYFDNGSKKRFELALQKCLDRGSKSFILRSFLRPDPVQSEALKKYFDPEASLSAERQDSTLLYKFQILKNL